MTLLQSWDENGDAGTILGLGDGAEGEASLELAYVEVPIEYKDLSLQFRVRDLSAFVETVRGRLPFQGPDERP